MTKSILCFLFASFIIWGCKKSETNTTEEEVLEIKGTIKLPTGMNQSVNGYSLNSYRTEQVLSNNEYTVEVTRNDFNLQFLSDPTSKDIMIGFSYPNQTDFTIDANSTVLGLVMKLPSVNSLSSQGKLNFISKLKTSSKYSDALIAVENHIKAGKDIFDTTDIVMKDKISQLFDQAALRRSGFGSNGQAYITKVDKTITIGNPGVSFAQVAGIYNNNQRIAKLDIDRYKFYVSSITEIPTALSSPPAPIEKSFTFTQDGAYQIKLRNGGFNPVTNDLESEEAIISNGINLVLDNIKVFLPVDVSANCPSAIYNAVKAKVDASKNIMKSTSDKTQFIALVYNITKATLNELKIGTSCASFNIKGNKYIDKIFKYLKWLDLVGKVGTNLNNSIFAFEYFTSNSNDPRSALDTTIIIGNPVVGSWKTIKYLWCGVDAWAVPVGQTVQTTCGYGITGTPSCYKDDLIIFKQNMTCETNEGATSCSPVTPTQFGSYTLNGNMIKTIIGTNTDTVYILQIDPTTLVVKHTNGDIATLQKQ